MTHSDPQLSTLPAALTLDISGDPQTPVPVPVTANRCACCGFWAQKLWDGTRAGHTTAHAVCTLCYLAGHLDSPSATHGRLAYLPGLSMGDIHHLQRRALLARFSRNEKQKRAGKRLWQWLFMHSREVEQAWGTAQASEFAVAFKRLPPGKRARLQARLAGCALIVPADRFEEDPSLLLPAGKGVEAALASRSWLTYTRSDLYVECDPLA